MLMKSLIVAVGMEQRNFIFNAPCSDQQINSTTNGNAFGAELMVVFNRFARKINAANARVFKVVQFTFYQV